MNKLHGTIKSDIIILLFGFAFLIYLYNTTKICRKKGSSLFPEPPPSYDMAMAAYYAQQQILAQAQAARRNATNDDAPLLIPTVSEESSSNPGPSLTAGGNGTRPETVD